MSTQYRFPLYSPTSARSRNRRKATAWSTATIIIIDLIISGRTEFSTSTRNISLCIFFRVIQLRCKILKEAKKERNNNKKCLAVSTSLSKGKDIRSLSLGA